MLCRVLGGHRAILTSGSSSSTPRSWKGAVLEPVGGSATARGGSGPAQKFKLLDVMLEKTWHSGARRRRGTRARRDDRARRARKRRAWIVWIDDHDASQRRTHVPAGPVDRPRAAPTVGAARPE